MKTKFKFLSLIGLASMAVAGVAAIIGGVSSKKVESAEAATKTEDASKIILYDQVKWNYRSLHMYSVTYDSEYSSTEFENFLSGFYGPKTNSFNKEGSTACWALNGGNAGDYFICAGGSSNEYTFRFPWWVKSASIQVMNNSNWVTATDGFKYHKTSYLYMYSGTNISITDGGAYTYGFECVTISKKAINSDTKAEISGSSLGSDTSVIYNKYPNGASAPADPEAITGYSFGGWYMNSQLSIPFSKQVISADTIIYAKFVPVPTYTVTFNNEDGTLIETKTNVARGSSVSINNPSKSDSGNRTYSFDKWVDSNKADMTASLANVQSNLTVYASFTENWKLGRYLVGHFGSCTSFTEISDASVIMVPHNTDEMKALNVVLSKGDKLKTAYYDGSGLDYYYGYSYIIDNAPALGWFGYDGDGNIVCLASGSYSFYFKDAGYDYETNKKISVASDYGTAGQLAFKLHSFDPYVEEEEARTPGGEGYCRNNDRWGAVLAQYNELSSDEKAAFQAYASSADAYYSGAYARFAAWARANNVDPVTVASASNIFNFANNSSNSIWIIAALSLVGLTAVGGYFFYRKRKEI